MGGGFGPHHFGQLMKKLFGFKVIENSTLPEGWIIALSPKEAVAVHPAHKPMRFDYSKPELGWQIIGEE